MLEQIYLFTTRDASDMIAAHEAQTITNLFLRKLAEVSDVEAVSVETMPFVEGGLGTDNNGELYSVAPVYRVLAQVTVEIESRPTVAAQKAEELEKLQAACLEDIKKAKAKTAASDDFDPFLDPDEDELP